MNNIPTYIALLTVVLALIYVGAGRAVILNVTYYDEYSQFSPGNTAARDILIAMWLQTFISISLTP